MVQATDSQAGGRTTRLVDILYTVVRRAHHVRASHIRSHCDKAGLVLLSRLRDNGPTRLSDLAAAVQLDISTVSRQVRALCDGGFTEALEDPQDKRARLLQLTDKGAAEIEAVTNELEAVISRALSKWPRSDVDTLTTLLGRLADDLADRTEESAR